MPEVTVEFQHDDAHFQQLVFQRGKNIVDGELNSLQRISRINALRGGLAVHPSGGSSGVSGTVMAAHIRVVPTANVNELALEPVPGQVGVIVFRGYVIEITEPILFVASTDALDRYQQLYLQIEEAEVSSAADPTIKVEKLGETARRIRLNVAFTLGANNTDEAGSANTATDPWKSGVKAGLLALVKRPSAVTSSVFSGTEFFPYWRPHTDYETFAQQWKGCLKFFSTTSGSPGRIYVAYGSPNTVVFDGVGLALPPGFFDGFSGTVPSLRMHGSWSLSNPGDMLVVRSIVPRSANNGDISAASVPNNEQVLAEVVNVANMTDLTSPGGVVTDTFSGVIPIVTRLDGTTRFLVGDGRMITGLFGDPSTGGGGGSGTDSVLFVDSGNDQVDVHLGGYPAGTTRYATPVIRDRRLPSTGYIQLTYQALANNTTTPVYVRRYTANRINITPTAGLGNETYFTGTIETVNARFTGSLGAEWEADDSTSTMTSTASLSGVRKIPALSVFMPFVASMAHYPFAYGTPWAFDGFKTGATGFPELSTTLGGGLLNRYRDILSDIGQFSSLSFSGFGDPEIGDASVANRVTGMLSPKAWGVFDIDASGGGTVVSPLIGAGFSSSPTYTSAAGNTVLTFPLASGLAWTDSGKYAVFHALSGIPTRAGVNPGQVVAVPNKSSTATTSSVIMNVWDATNNDYDPCKAVGGGGGGMSMVMAIVAFGKMTSP